jgi:hypothetical protein
MHPVGPMKQASPELQRSPSTAEPSPLPALAASRGHVEPNGTLTSEKGRAQIACGSCRRSKTRCINQGSGSTCKHCKERNRVCEWDNGPILTATGNPRPRERSNGELDVSALPFYQRFTIRQCRFACLRWTSACCALLYTNTFFALPWSITYQRIVHPSRVKSNKTNLYVHRFLPRSARDSSYQMLAQHITHTVLSRHKRMCWNHHG